MKTQTRFRKWGVMLATLFAVMTTSSCKEGFIFEGEGDCGTYYNIKFKYDYNMKFADAFAHEVTSLSLYVFDQNDILVQTIIENDVEKLSSSDFTASLELDGGNYELIAWAGLGNEESFELLADIEVGKTEKEQLQVAIKDIDTKRVERDLKPLFHGAMSLEHSDEPGTYTETMSMVKNTNVVRVVLQQMSADMNADNFRFEITADNGLLDWDNDVIANATLTYSPWSIISGSTNVSSINTRSSQLDVAVAEFTVNRMIDGQSPILTVYNIAEDRPVLSIPIADYALLVKGNYNSDMGNQEFLDRQDEYNMTFFLDENSNWLSSSILINSWRVVLNDNVL